MLTLTATIFLASLLGSFHCAGMCGAFVTLASTSAGGGLRRQVNLQLAYHLGRLCTYIALGASAGAFGHLLNLASTLAGLKPAAAILAGVVMVSFGLVSLLRVSGFHVGPMKLPAGWISLMQLAHRSAMNRPPVIRATLIGLLTTMLPCGWLYAFVATAAGSGNAIYGAMMMAVFWAGTLPMLVTIGAGARALLGPLASKLPTITAFVLIGAGIYTLAGRTLMNPIALAGRVESTTNFHARSGAAPARISAVPTKAPCCETHEHRD